MKVPEELVGYVREMIYTEQETAERKNKWAVILGLVPFRDGNQWCVLYGRNLQQGIAAFGETPEKAINAFDVEMNREIGETDD